MADDSRQADDKKLSELLTRRSRLRWSLTTVLVVAYLAYGMAGLYMREAMGLPFMGSAMPRGLVAGYTIIFLAIALSLYYIRRVNQLVAIMKETAGESDK